MAGKYISLYTLPTPAAAAEAPVFISKGELLMDRFSEKLFIRLEMQSLDERMIHAVKLCLQLFDEVGAPIDTAVEYRYGSLKIKRDQKFGENRTVPIQNSNVRSFSVFLTNVTFSDYSFWENDLPFQKIGRMQTLEEALGSEMLAKQFEAQYGSDCHYFPVDENVIWYCTCGAINRADEERCHTCRRKRSALCEVNLDAIKMEAKNHSGDGMQDENAKATDINEQFRKYLFRVLLILLPVILVTVLIISTVPPFLERQRAYQKAELLLNQHKYDEAQIEFENLGDYRNSRLQSEKEIPYQKALFLIDAAQKADASAFSTVGLEYSATEIEDDDGLVMALYDSAREFLEKITPYKDADKQLDNIKRFNEEYEEKMKENAYSSAVGLLEKGAYLKARVLFLNLEDYSDSAEKSKECLYRRAVSVLDFCENHNVRHIFTSISDTLEEKTLISMPGALLTELGSDTVFELKKCFVEDGVEFIYEDTLTKEGFVPICESIRKEFEKLGEYKDSADLADRAREAGDFSRPFYQLLRTGELDEAIKWLQKYSDEISDSEEYTEWLETVKTLCSEWKLSMGDPTLIPFSVGNDPVKLEYFSTSITIENKIATMHIVPDDGSYEICLTAEFGKNLFSWNPDGSVYYGYINQVGRFVYIRYTQNGTILSSCEYVRK